MLTYILNGYEFTALMAVLFGVSIGLCWLIRQAGRMFKRKYGEGTLFGIALLLIATILCGITISIPKHEINDIAYWTCIGLWFCGLFAAHFQYTSEKDKRRAISSALRDHGAKSAALTATSIHAPSATIPDAYREIGVERLVDAIVQANALHYAVDLLLDHSIVIDDAQRKKLIGVIVKSGDAFAARDIIINAPVIDNEDRRSLLSTSSRQV